MTLMGDLLVIVVVAAAIVPPIGLWWWHCDSMNVRVQGGVNDDEAAVAIICT